MKAEERFSGLGSIIYIGKMNEDGGVEDWIKVNVKEPALSLQTTTEQKEEEGFGQPFSRSFKQRFSFCYEQRIAIIKNSSRCDTVWLIGLDVRRMIHLRRRKQKATARKNIRFLKERIKEWRKEPLDLPFKDEDPCQLAEERIKVLRFFIKGRCTVPAGNDIFYPAMVHFDVKFGGKKGIQAMKSYIETHWNM